MIRWGFKLTWMILGITIAAEAAGKAVMNTGIASQLRPRRYYTVPRETLDVLIGDVHELVNFVVIEAQRIVFAENIWASLAVCTSRNQLDTPAKVVSRLELTSVPPPRSASAHFSRTGSLRSSRTGVSRSSAPPSSSPLL